jgi:hypothetical protein
MSGPVFIAPPAQMNRAVKTSDPARGNIQPYTLVDPANETVMRTAFNLLMDN